MFPEFEFLTLPFRCSARWSYY